MRLVLTDPGRAGTDPRFYVDCLEGIKQPADWAMVDLQNLMARAVLRIPSLHKTKAVAYALRFEADFAALQIINAQADKRPTTMVIGDEDTLRFLDIPVVPVSWGS